MSIAVDGKPVHEVRWEWVIELSDQPDIIADWDSYEEWEMRLWADGISGRLCKRPLYVMEKEEVV